MQRKKLSLGNQILFFSIMLCLLPLISAGGYIIWLQPTNPIGYVCVALGVANLVLTIFGRLRIGAFLARLEWVAKRVANGDLTLLQRPDFRFSEQNTIIRYLNELTLALLDQQDEIESLKELSAPEAIKNNAELDALNRYLEKEIEEYKILLNGISMPHPTFANSTTSLNLNQNAAQVDVPTYEDTFIARLGHELRTPLNAIIGYSALLEETAIDEGDCLTADDAAQIKRAAHSLTDLINQLLDFTEIQSKSMQISKSKFSLDNLVEKVACTIQPLAEQNGNELQIINHSPRKEIFSDEAKLRQILTHLLGNAVRGTSNGTISLDLSLGDDAKQTKKSRVQNLVIQIQDQNIKSRGKLFGSSGTDQVENEREIGWALTQDFIERLGGTMRVRDEFGDNLNFQLKIPIGNN